MLDFQTTCLNHLMVEYLIFFYICLDYKIVETGSNEIFQV